MQFANLLAVCVFAWCQGMTLKQRPSAMILRNRRTRSGKNHCLSDSGNQSIPRKQIHGEIPSEVDFFAPNSNFSKSRNFYLLTRREFLVWVRFYVDTDPLRSCVALRGRNRSRNCEVRACSGRSVANSQSYRQTAKISVDTESAPGP